MTYLITINVTPQAFGNLAAAAIARGQDITSFVAQVAAKQQVRGGTAPTRPTAKPARAEEKKERDDKTAIMSLADQWCYADN